MAVNEHSIFQSLLNQLPLPQREFTFIIQKNGLVIKSARLKNLLGWTSLSRTNVSGEYLRILGDNQSKVDLLAQQQAASDPMQQSFSGLMRCVTQGNLIDMQATLAEIPIELTSVHQYANRQLVAT